MKLISFLNDEYVYSWNSGKWGKVKEFQSMWYALGSSPTYYKSIVTGFFSVSEYIGYSVKAGKLTELLYNKKLDKKEVNKRLKPPPLNLGGLSSNIIYVDEVDTVNKTITLNNAPKTPKKV